MSFVDAVSRLVEKKDDSSILVKRLVKYLDDYEDDYGNDSSFHVSGLHGMCPRLEIYKRIIPEELLPSERLDNVTRARFDVGNALHYWYQNKYLGPMGVLRGKWLCQRCGEEREGFMPKGGSCSSRGCHWVFQESSVFSKEWNIVGKCDGIVVVDDKEYLLDLKTCKPSLFASLSKPWPSAIMQVQIYLWLTGLRKGLLLYIDKSVDGTVPVKEFMVEYSDKAVEDAKGKITSFRFGMETRSLPDCMCGRSSFKYTCSEVEAVPEAMKIVEQWEKQRDGKSTVEDLRE
jgi:hypothetical protein